MLTLQFGGKWEKTYLQRLCTMRRGFGESFTKYMHLQILLEIEHGLKKIMKLLNRHKSQLL